MAKAKKGSTSPPQLYIMGDRSIEWSPDGLNFYTATMKDSESFGEFASRCFAAFKP